MYSALPSPIPAVQVVAIRATPLPRQRHLVATAIIYSSGRENSMETMPIALRLPPHLYEDLQALAVEEQSEPVEVIARLIAQARRERSALPEQDPVLGLIGFYDSKAPFIDDIPVSEDPDLYVAAATLGAGAAALHAWEIAPTRYTRGPDARPIRREPGANEA